MHGQRGLADARRPVDRGDHHRPAGGSGGVRQAVKVREFGVAAGEAPHVVG
jgi:hypothetical protein